MRSTPLTARPAVGNASGAGQISIMCLLWLYVHLAKADGGSGR